MYKLTGVTKTFSKGSQTGRALTDVDLDIDDGAWLAVQGRTGHGKTTLLYILGGLDRPSSGVVEFAGQDLDKLREAQLTRVRASSIGFIFQTFNLIPTLSALANGEGALIPLAVSTTELNHRARQALPDGGLSARLRHLPS